MVRVLITGGTGFIGAHLVRDCLKRGDDVSVLTRPGSDLWRLEDVLPQIRLHTVDVLDPRAVKKVLDAENPQRVFLIAAATRFRRKSGLGEVDQALRANVDPLRIMLDAISDLPDPPAAVVRTGTLAEISTDTAVEDAPANIYGLSLLMGTHLQRIWREWTGIPAVTARLCLTYGAGQSEDFFIPEAIAKALNGRFEAPRQPGARRDLLHVDDVVAALQLIADHAGELPATINLSTGDPQRLGDVGDIIATLTGQSETALSQVVSADQGADDIVSCPPSAELASLGWMPRVTLREGIAQVIDWQRERDATSRRRHLA
ncbi:NAD(P)-dependent oxidoreductase [Paracoccus aurantiacus]|uniref:NAD(P)-dependent oxidoreductase n=1 Tax=Paracoccus aurantiacus TaxID=2599412 RepID=A0A5C6RXN4_9RHOB|nr:NAD(P)-dependent oxidoreductase [Paracoccus aurantiacus]TXB66370.1 NAD(P)-dependent oxidoreductase [Paracoccus aurantiacus]